MLLDVATKFRQVAKKQKPVTEEEAIVLLRKWRDEKCVKSREQLIFRCLYTCVIMAGKYSGYNASLDDLYQVGSMGVIKAIDSWDEKRPFLITLWKWVDGEIKQFIFNTASIVVMKDSGKHESKRAFWKIRSTMRMFNGDIGKACDHLGITREKGMQALNAHYGVIGLYDDEGNVIHDLEVEDVITENISSETLMGLVKQQLVGIEPKQYDIIKSRYMTELPEPRHSIGKRWGISGSRVEQIEKNVMAKLKTDFSHLQDSI